MKVISRVKFVFCILFAALLLALGFVFLSFLPNTRNAIKVEATISLINNETNEVSVVFYVDGIRYERLVNFFDDSLNIGDSISVFYTDLNNENEVVVNEESNTLFKVLPAIAFSLGSLGLICSIIMFKKEKKLIHINESKEEAFKKELNDEKLNGNVCEYLFHFTNNRAKLHEQVLENKYGNIVCSSYKENNSFFKPSTFVFIDHQTGFKKKFRVGITHTSYSMFGQNKLSYFNIDSKNIWDYIKARGIDLHFNFNDVRVAVYTIKVRGELVAKIESVPVLDATSYKFPVAKVYKVQSKEDVLDMVHLVCFALSRTEVYIAN